MKNQIQIQYYKTKIGELILGIYQDKLCLLDYRYRKMRTSVDNRLKRILNAEFIEENNAVLEETKKQIDEYLNQQRTEFDIPILLLGTDFQKRVWEALINIEYGKTASYLDLAKIINNEKVVRAVATANGANAIALIIPCHRIIGNDGKLVGYGGGLSTKQKLLDLENHTKKSQLHLDI